MTSTALRDAIRPSAASAAAGEVVREAAAKGTPLRIVGGGTWLDAGRPTAAGAAPFSLADDAGIIEYVPGDLTLTARAGTTLGTIARATAAEGQRLALDPFGPDEGTIGATVATASSGPLAQLFGGPRDNVLGLEFITGTGTVARGGGRVVKNVAGFDLTRLMTGAWGTLGVITEVSLRLRSLPERDETIVIAIPREHHALAERVERARVAPAAPWTLELVNDSLARHLGLGAGNQLLVRLGGNEPVVTAQRDTFAGIGDIAVADPVVWARMRSAEPRGAVVFRLSGLPARLATTWQAAEACCAPFPGALVHATVGRGVVRCVIPHRALEAVAESNRLPSHESHPLVRALGLAARAPGRIFERLPAPLWDVLAPSLPNAGLHRAIGRAFDPHRILNAGLFGASDG